MKRLKGLYILRPDVYDDIYGPSERRDIAELIDISVPPQTAVSIQRHPELLSGADLILSGWGMPRLDEALLAYAPQLSAVFYGAGSIRYFATEAMWRRGIQVS